MNLPILRVPLTSAFAGFWSSQEEAASFVQHHVFEDEDEHIRVSVEEVLSDEVCVQAVVKYAAKDAEGVEWLKEYDPGQQGAEDDVDNWLGVQPDSSSGKAEGQKKLSRFYEPKKIRLSRLSVVVYRKNTGLFVEGQANSIYNQEFDVSSTFLAAVWRYRFRNQGSK